MNTPQNDGGAAFPSKMLVNRFATEESAQKLIGSDGMSLRDYYAAKAMSALICEAFIDAGRQRRSDPDEVMQKTARAAFIAADAMIKAREEYR